jgi:hypothetical protein
MTASTKDTYAQLGFRDIRDNVIITDTHLVGVLMVSGVNLFEMQESQAQAHMIALGQAMNLIGVPVQLVTHSRPKQFDPHISEVRNSWKKNDFNLEFEKTREYFDIKYEKELKSGIMMKQDIDSIFDRAPSIIKKSMLDSYVERLDYVVSKYEIKEKRYYFVISSLKAPEKIDEDKEQDYPFLDFTIGNVYESQKKILDENARIAADHLREAAGLDTFRLEYDHLTNLMYDGFNFPESYRHQFNTSITEY